MLIPERESGQALWEAPLVAESPPTDRAAPGSSEWGLRAGESARDMPVIRIEPPQVCTLAEGAGGDVVAAARSAIPDVNFFLVRLDFSLRPKPGEVQIEWARLRVEMLPSADGLSALAQDMHPWTVEQEVKHHVNVDISPSLKFQEVEFSAGSHSHTYDYATLEPTISAAGRGGNDLTWDFSAFKDGTVAGGKRVHALVSVPTAMNGVEARLSFSADLLVERKFRRAAGLRVDDDPLAVNLIATLPGESTQ